MSTSGFPMLSGLGEASYAANSAPQSLVLLRCRPFIERAIAEQQARFLEMQQQQPKKAAEESAAAAADNKHKKVFRLADMGSSSGPNCLTNMQFMLEAIKKYKHCSDLELQFFFCDLPSNDFNTLMQRQQNIIAADGRCFGAAVGGTVYGRLFPASSLHLVFSSFCLHWLSQIPKAILIPGTMEWNKGKIWVDGPLANEATGRAFYNQWQEDLKIFLKCRNEEMVNGGLMIILTLCRDDSFPPHKMLEDNCFTNLELACQQLLQEEVLEESDLDSFNIPSYFPTIQEIKDAVLSIPSLTIQRFEVLEETIGDTYWEQWSKDPSEWAKRVANFYKSIYLNIVEEHVGVTKCEAIFQRFRDLLNSSFKKRSHWKSSWAHPCSSSMVLQVLKNV